MATIKFLKRWWKNFLIIAKEKCTLGNLIDLSVMSVFALANAVMSAAHPIVTTITTAAAIGLSYVVDERSNLIKINKLRKLKGLLDEGTEETGSLELKYPYMSKGKWLFFGLSTSCLGGYVIISFMGGAAPVFGVVAVVGASTIFHIAKKFYNSPLAGDIHTAESRLSEVVRKRLPEVLEQEEQEQTIATLRSEKEASEKYTQEFQQHLNELRIQTANLERERDDLQRQLEKAVEVISELRQSADDSSKQNMGLTAKVAELERANVQLRQNEVVLQKQLVVAGETINSLEMVVKDSSEDLSSLKGQCQDLQEKLRLECERSEFLKGALESLEHKLEVGTRPEM